MNAPKLLTWLDVRRTICIKTNYGMKLPGGVAGIRCFSDALEIGVISQENIVNATNALKEWFKDWYEEDLSIIHLTFGDNAILPVEIIVGEEKREIDINIRPFWEEIAYIGTNSEDEGSIVKSVKLPEPYTEKPNLIAFYSFKGGVGRTLNLSAHLFALLDRAKELDSPIKVLVIDADLEAPGLTYWNAFDKQKPSVSFIDFLEVYHYSPFPREETLSLFAREVKKLYRNEGKSTVYFLPSCLDDKQLLDTPILPENLVRSPQGSWEYGNAIYNLGRAIGVDYIFIDLRAGLSEISSPIVFDPRIQRFLVTTINQQSVRGTSLVLQQIGRIAAPETKIDNENYYDPALLISMLTPELRELPVFDDALIAFESAYIQPREDKLYSTRLEIKETYFAQELLYIDNWESARIKFRSTTVMQIAQAWSEIELPTNTIQESISKLTQEENIITHVRKLRDICRSYEYAEEGKSEDLLVTEPLKNLAISYSNELPHVVSIGAKGAGKTFNYIQLSRFKYWETFLNRINNTDLPKKTHIFPLLESSNLKDNAKTVINEAREEIISRALPHIIPEFKYSEYKDTIKKAIASRKLNEIEWTEFWIMQIAQAMGINSQSSDSHLLSKINNELQKQKLHVIFLFDGLEDIFTKITSDEQEKLALKALIDDLPKKLSEIRNSNIGLIIFLRRDFLRYTITQNINQFENLYESYDLSWNQDSFLKLVYWICSQSKVIDTNSQNIDSLVKENFKEQLEKLWGKKLGTDKSTEAYTASWVFAALTDFNGRIQARDIVRLLYNAAKITVDISQDIQFKKWSTTRLLPPEAIRRALKPCSEEKVKEAKEEYPIFKKWVEQELPNYPTSTRRIPFADKQYGMDLEVSKTLEEMGVIYEDKEKENIERFYMPEIFREGLGFSGTDARLRLLALKRKVLGKGIL